MSSTREDWSSLIHPDDRRATLDGRYRTLSADLLPDYLRAFPDIAQRLGGSPSHWRAREMGDGNLNLVFIVEGCSGTVVVKQALPYVRMVGSSWPLSLRRSHYEQLALLEQAKCVAAFVPDVYHVDPAMASIIMQHLTPHVVLRKAMIRGIRLPLLGSQLGTFLARLTFGTSDLGMSAQAKKDRIGAFLGNTAMCKITEDLIFDEPYFAAPMNRHTAPYLDAAALSLQSDTPLKLAVQEMKWSFLNAPECLTHGDLHTGSVMVTPDETRVIDPEFAFFGPMGFDLGMITANLLMGYLSQAGHRTPEDDRHEYGEYLLTQVRALWETFASLFEELCDSRQSGAAGNVYEPRLCRDAPELSARACAHRLGWIWKQSLGFAGAEMIRRVVGLSHIEDFESIGHAALRADCEARALRLGRDLLVGRSAYANIDGLLDRAQADRACPW